MLIRLSNLRKRSPFGVLNLDRRVHSKAPGQGRLPDSIKENINVSELDGSKPRIYDFPPGYLQKPQLGVADYQDSALVSKSSGQRAWAVIPFQSKTPASARLWLQSYIQNKALGSSNTDPQAQTDGHSSAKKERKILEKRMRDSIVQVFLPFKSEPSIREDYMNFYAGVRISKVLEDLDALAGSVSYLHCDDCDDATPPLTIVTAAVERIDMLQRMFLDKDYRIFGFVTFVGSSSMEITIQMDVCEDYSAVDFSGTSSSAQKIDESFKLIVPDPVLVAKFTMVARDKETGKAAKINTLNLVTEQERELCAQGMLLKSKKLFASQMALTKRAPAVEEVQLIHQLYLQSLEQATGGKPDSTKAVWMDETIMETHVLCMPQDRNIHGFVFGGYLMKLAYELAYSNALLFSGHRPFFLSLDDISFREPVPVGSLVRLTCEVVYSSGCLDQTYQLRVDAAIVNHLTKRTRTTNEFQFTFYSPSKDLPRVMPKTYAEAMRLIDGLRRKRASKIVDPSDLTNSNLL